MTAKTTTAKKTAAAPKTQPEPPAPATEGTKPARKPKMQHVLYRQNTETGDLADVLVHGDKTRAWEDLATNHTGLEGWKYIEVGLGASVRDAVQEAGR